MQGLKDKQAKMEEDVEATKMPWLKEWEAQQK
jgi:hypothetical protein